MSATLVDRSAAADAKRFRFVLRSDPRVLACIAYRYKAACAHQDPIAAIDAAMLQQESRADDGLTDEFRRAQERERARTEGNEI